VDSTIAELRGLEGLTLFEDALDAGLARAARTPGYAGVTGAAADPAGAVPSANGGRPAADAVH